uniref:Nucleoside diphosphate kinase n=1 Tax=Nelumbo nucifera TaxID=4432 RepID=A0A822ZVA8_NELNU|nr:TPA_asm: hypothetical protein HUJ06_017212 [Nelumbo nucifera]
MQQHSHVRISTFAKLRLKSRVLTRTQKKIEQTFIMIKPDGIQRGLVGEIINRFEKKGFSLKGLKLMSVERAFAEKHYEDLKIIGATNPSDSPPGTIRGDYAIEIGRNVIHGSDSIESAKKEIALWFPDGTVG